MRIDLLTLGAGTAVFLMLAGAEPQPTAPVAAPVAVKTAPSLAERFAAERPAMIAAMQKALDTKDYYAALGYEAEFKAVSDPEFAALASRVVAAETKATALALKQQEAKDKAEARKKGVHIGMSREQVAGSNWGRPQHVNTTRTRYGVREQWVYGGRNYLYFEDGVLTTIQN